MKIRIQGNAIRIRLSKSEVDKLTKEGFLEESTSFGLTSFHYNIKTELGLETLSANYADNCVTMLVPDHLLANWSMNNTVGFESHMRVSETETLYLLLEKDFKCLDNTLEDQSDNFENPNKSC